MYNKKYLIIAINLLLVFLINCSVETNINGPGYDGSWDPDNPREKISGSGYLITKTLQLDEFDSIIFNIPGRITVEQGDEQSVEVTVDDNIYGYLTIRTIGNDLEVSKRTDASLDDYHLSIKITMTDLESLSTNSTGTIEGEGKFTVDRISLHTNSVGSIILSVDADEIDTHITSVGSVYLSGTVREHTAYISSIGSLSSFSLEAERVLAHVNSIGSAEIYATERLEASVTSLGNVYYKGDPEVIVLSMSSLGRIIKVY